MDRSIDCLTLKYYTEYRIENKTGVVDYICGTVNKPLHETWHGGDIYIQFKYEQK